MRTRKGETMRKADAAALQVRAERDAARAREVAVLEALASSLVCDDEPPVQGERALPVPPEVVGTNALLVLPRDKGSELRIFRRQTVDLDGVESVYALLCVWFNGAGGLRFRSKGVAIGRSDLVAVGECLIALADDLDAADGVP